MFGLSFEWPFLMTRLNLMLKRSQQIYIEIHRFLVQRKSTDFDEIEIQTSVWALNRKHVS